MTIRRCVCAFANPVRRYTRASLRVHARTPHRSVCGYGAGNVAPGGGGGALTTDSPVSTCANTRARALAHAFTPTDK